MSNVIFLLMNEWRVIPETLYLVYYVTHILYRKADDETHNSTSRSTRIIATLCPLH